MANNRFIQRIFESTIKKIDLLSIYNARFSTRDMKQIVQRTSPELSLERENIYSDMLCIENRRILAPGKVQKNFVDFE